MTRISYRRLASPCLVLAAVGLLGQHPAAAQSAPAQPDAKTLAKYDANKNGRLDPAELTAMQADQAKAGDASKATPTTEQKGAGDEVVQLTPFEVNGAEDKGYYGAHTLSGTRLNSKIEDLGASITVVTKQQMQDFALRDVNDIFLYEAGTEGTGNYTDFSVDRSGNVTDNVQSNPNNANRVRGIGPANTARGNYLTSGAVPIDPIDIDAVEISRGPNSSIFGLGNASGTVNLIPATANVNRAFTNVEGQVSSLGSVRSSLDLNRPVLRNKLAIRASAVWQQDEYQRKPSVSRSKRYNGMVTWHPFKYTKLRASVQYYEAFDRRPNAVTPRDGFSNWLQNGSPVWDAAASTVTRNGVATFIKYNANQGGETAQLGPGLESPGSAVYARGSIFVNPDGTIGQWTVSQNVVGGNSRYVESAPPASKGALFINNTAPITDKSIYDWSSINMAASNWGRTRARNFTVELEQFFVSTQRNSLGMQIGWNREETAGLSRNFIGQGGGSPMVVYADVNKTFVDGTANPYFGDLYINAAEPVAYRSRYFRDTFRGQLAYQLSLAQEKSWLHWLGNHQLSGYAEYKNSINASYGYHDAIVSDHSWLAAGTNRANGPANARGYYRYYVGDSNGNNIDNSTPDWASAAGTHDFTWYDATNKKWVTEPTTIGEAYFQAGRTWRTRNLIKTQGAILQSHLLNDRVIPTFGLRTDTNLNRDSAGTGLQPDGITADLVANRTWPNNWLRRQGRTKTAGVVVKPFRSWKWIDNSAASGGLRGFVARAVRSLDVFYNTSDSFLPQSIAQNLAGELLPDASGRDRTYGIGMSFFDDRLMIRYRQYHTVQERTRFGDSGIIASRAGRIDFSVTTGGSDRFNLYRNAREWVIQLNPTWTADQIDAEVAKEMGFPRDQLARMNAYPISDTSDVTSNGKEVEINFNPNRFFRSKLNVAQTESIDNHLSPGIQTYLNARMPLWTTIVDPRTRTAGPDGLLNTADDVFQTWWKTRYGSTGTPEDFFLGSVQAPYHLAVANEGKTKSQIRKWRVNALSSLQLSALSDNRFLQRMSVSGAVRWEDKASIGYYTMANDINTFDPSRPIYDKTHTYIDAGVSYSQKIYRNRVNMRLQLNVRNLTENGRLQAVAAYPDGNGSIYRIIDPRLFILTASFEL
jgi:hypothetical protein